MSAVQKWVAVDAADLKAGDKVRVVCEELGDVMHADVLEGAGFVQLASHSMLAIVALSAAGYRFEREQAALPTEPGLYLGEGDDPNYGPIYLLSAGGYWMRDEPRGSGSVWDQIPDHKLPADLTRLVPSTEADELRSAVMALVGSLSEFDIKSSVKAELLAIVYGGTR